MVTQGRGGGVIFKPILAIFNHGKMMGGGVSFKPILVTSLPGEVGGGEGGFIHRFILSILASLREKQ